MANTKAEVVKFRIDKNTFGSALANFINSNFPGESVAPSEIDADNPPVIDPDDGTLVLITLKEAVV